MRGEGGAGGEVGVAGREMGGAVYTNIQEVKWH